MVSLGRGRLPPFAGRPRAHWLNAKQGAGPRARPGGSGRFRSRESGLGFHRESPAVAAAADPPALPAARPASPGLASSSAKSRRERRRKALKVVGLSAAAGWAGRGVLREPGSRGPGASHETASVPGGKLKLWKEKSNCSLPKDAKLRRPVPRERPRARRGLSRRALPGLAGREPGAFREAEAPVHAVRPRVRPGTERGRARLRLGRPLRPTPGAMPPAPRAPRERREHGEVE